LKKGKKGKKRDVLLGGDIVVLTQVVVTLIDNILI